MRCCGLNIFLFFLFHIPTEFFAQETNYSVDQLGIKEGLTQNSVNTIYQDHNGLIWIGTQDGLNRFDGYRFTQFRKDPNNKFSLLDNFIIKIIGSQDSGLWIVTNEGLNKYNQNTNSFSPVLKNKLEQNSKFSIKIKTIIEGEKGILWLRTDDGIIEYHVGEKKFYEYLSPVETYENISNDNTFSLIFDNNYNLWSGSGNGLICFDTRTKQFSVYPLNNSEVFSVNKLTDKIFVVGTKSEAFYFYPMSGQFQKINSTLNLSCVKSIIKDRSNILWFGTQYGLMYLDTLKNSIIPFPLENYIRDELKVGDI
jgi:ligand-binding sensor domain-containing protein